MTRAPVSRTDLEARAVEVERLGLDVLAVPDRQASLCPFQVITAAARVTERILLRTYVLDPGRWTVGALVRAARTTNLLTGGRTEVGLGLGHNDPDVPSGGGAAERVGRLRRAILAVRGAVSEVTESAAAMQPVIVATTSEAGLRVAAECADVVSLGGIRLRGRDPIGIAGSQYTHDLVQRVRAHAEATPPGGRDVGLDMLLPAVVVDRDPGVTARRIAASDPLVTAEEVLDSPFLLLASSPLRAAEELVRHHHDYGFTSVITDERHSVALARVAAEMRGM